MDDSVVQIVCPRCQKLGRAVLDRTPPATTPGPFSCTFFVPQYEVFCGCPQTKRVEWDDLEDWVYPKAGRKP